ncbi:NAD-dependent DNA ligase LigA [[Mycoplasma] falconis]|uniref:DNA ligase n=1 Tax=[Mycoplasma] falconis TaxID=92403 RepID=A0A501XAU2_9BACT|nr:NAD-dependent DNA ligase LigA [[Mycoplasma] falconis]TPE57414.1 NAD-dependent DNA ligase LigA [[Mycoplasma] falconis]
MSEKEIKIKEEILQIQKQISEWDHHYYDLDNPLVSDEIYDITFNKLKNLEQTYSYLFSYEELKNSPTQKINANSLEIFSKVKHDKPMLSLNKAYTIEEIEKFIDNIKKITLNYSFWIEPKIDGLSVSIKYKNGLLYQATTRGDGSVGEDVTQNVLQIASIPKQIDYFKDLEVRGEIYLSISNFKKLNESLLALNKPAMANPRNAAAGTLRQLDANIVKERNLSAFLYYVVDPLQHNIETMQQQFDFLNKLGFQTTLESEHITSIEAIKEYINTFKDIKQKLDYETDGIVIKLNEVKYYDELGYTAKFPHSAIAFKYEPDTAITTLKDIFITIGRTGLVTYNASLEPVELSGSLVSFATLNNFQYITDLQINKNDLVYIKKAGEIIPCVIGLASKISDLKPFEKIKLCPYCKSNLQDNETGLEQYCLNENCPEIKRRKLVHFVSKDAMDINTLGDKNIELLINNNLLTSVIDLYKLKDKKEQLSNLERMGEKSVNKIIDNIEKSKFNSLDRLIFALSIKLIGAKVAKFVASKVLNLKSFLTYDFMALTEYHEIGEKIATSLQNWVNQEENQKLINDLIEIGLDLKYQTEEINNKLNNNSLVITGILSKPRSYFEKLIIANGGITLNSISKKTNYLLVGQDAGSKLDKAKKLNVKIINENEFYELIKD